MKDGTAGRHHPPVTSRSWREMIFSPGYEPAVSEVVGIVFLIAIAITAFGIIGAVLLPDSVPSAIPGITVIAWYHDPGLPGNYTINLVHDGGDPVIVNNTKILVNGYLIGNPDRALVQDDGSGTWRIGSTIQLSYNRSPPPFMVDIIYTGGGGETLMTKISRVTQTT